MPNWKVDPKIPLKRECFTCGRNIKPDERAFRIDGVHDAWKCDTCQFKHDQTRTEKEMRKGNGLTRIEKARLKLTAAIYN